MKSAYALLVLLAACARTQANIPEAPAPSANDPPARVARISYLKGEVSLRVGGVEDWTAAVLNRPLTTGDELWTGDGGRAELHTGNAALRLDSHTSVALLEVGTNAVQVKLTEGTLSLHLRELDENEEFEIDTPDGAIALLRAGEYRVEVGTATTVIARSGMAEITGPGVSFILRQAQQARVPGEAAQSYTVTAASPTDSFDEFCATRDAREERALAAKRVPPRLIGYEDLNEYGDWRSYPEYGWIWVPHRVPAGWAPYRFGHWVWIEPWGWTWVDEAPWGFAPFHYGRWVYIEARWVWIPGPYHRRPIYAPALVVFIGGGRPGLRIHFRLEVGLGVAWFPLGPREVWFPPYRASRTYVTNVNITNTVVVNPANLHRIDASRQHYRNRGVENAVTAVPEDVFRHARPVDRGAVRVTAREAREASIGGSAPPVAPIPDSLTRGERRTQAPPRSQREQVVVNRRPPPAPVPFEQRRPALEESPGRAPDRGRVDQIRREQPQRTPEYRQEPRRQPRESPPAAREQPKPDAQRDRQWDQRTRREETSRSKTIEKERQQEQRTRDQSPRRRQ